MMRPLRICILAVGAVAMTGCFHIKYTTNQLPAPSPAYDEWHHDFIFGLVEVTAPVNVTQACPNGFALVENEQSFVNGFVGFITGSIWTPLTVSVTCSSSKADTPQSPVTPPVAALESKATQ